MVENKEIAMKQDNAKNSTGIQAGVINIYKGVSEEQCRKICLSLYKENILSFQGEAKKIALQRVEKLVSVFLEKLCKSDEIVRKKIEETLKEPAMQEVLFKAQKGYAFSNNEEHLEILTNMLIDRGQISNRSNKQMLIDDAIEVLPKLTQEHLDILSFYLDFVSLLPNIKFKEELDVEVDRLVNKFEKIYPVDINYLKYLQHKMCLEKYSSLESLKAPEVFIAQKTQLLTNGFDFDDFNNSFGNRLNNIITRSLINPNKYVFIFSRKAVLEEHLRKQNIYFNISKYWLDSYNYPVIKNYLLSNYPKLKIIYDFWDILSQFDTSLLGKMIASSYIYVNEGRSINWDFK